MFMTRLPLMSKYAVVFNMLKRPTVLFFFQSFFFLKIALRDEFANLTSLPFKIYDVTLHPTVQEDISKCISVFVNLQKGASQSSTL
jgi:hypothetical protein